MSRVQELKRWFNDNKALALGFDVPTLLDEAAIQAVQARPSSPVKNNTSTTKSSPTKTIAKTTVDNQSNAIANNTIVNVKNDTVRTELMNTVFIVKNNSTNADNSGTAGPLEVIKKEAPQYGRTCISCSLLTNTKLVPLGQLDPKSKSMVDLICKVELVAQETNLKKVWIWDGTCNPPGPMILVVWNKSLPNFGNPTDKWVLLTRVKISTS